MSHYCCKRCGQQYDDCDCPPLVRVQKAEPPPKIRQTVYTPACIYCGKGWKDHYLFKFCYAEGS